MPWSRCQPHGFILSWRNIPVNRIGRFYRLFVWMRRLSCGALEVNGRVRPPSCSSRPVTGPTQHCAVSESHSCPCVSHPPPLRRSPARPTPLPVYIRPNAASRRRTFHCPAKQISASPRQRGITSPQWNRHSQRRIGTAQRPPTHSRPSNSAFRIASPFPSPRQKNNHPPAEPVVFHMRAKP